MPNSVRRSELPKFLALAGLVFLGACAGPTTVAIHSPRPADAARIPGAERVGVSLRVVDARSNGGHPDASRAIGFKLGTPGAPGGASVWNVEPVQVLVERSVRDELTALGYQVRDEGPARLTIEIRVFEQRFQGGTAAGGAEADVYLSFTASNASGADCLWDFVNIRIREDEMNDPGSTARAGLERALGGVMKYLADKVALHDALKRAARTGGASSC